MKQYGEGENRQLLQPLAELEVLKHALRQEREQAALAREETESFRQQLQKLKGYIKDSQNEAKEAKEKAVLLQQQVDKSLSQNGLSLQSQVSIEAENASYKMRLEKLATLLRERDKKIVELQQYEISFRKMNEQKTQHDSTVEQHLMHIHSLENELRNAYDQQQESHQKVEQLEVVVQELNKQHTDSQDEMEALQAQFDSLKKNLEQSKQDLETSVDKQNEVGSFLQVINVASLDEARIQFENIQEQLQIARKEKADKEALLSERDSLQESLAHAKNAQEDAESRLKIAHQHLAKKVKETAILNDSAQMHQEQLLDLQGQLNLSKSRIGEMQQALDAHVLQENRLQEQIQQSVRSVESLTSKWEEKYFKVYEKWQEAEVRIREMKKLEDKCSQMQSLLANISGVFGVPFNSPNPSSTSSGATPRAFTDMLSAQLPLVESRVAEEEQVETVCEEKPVVAGFYGQLAQPHLHSDSDEMTFTASIPEGIAQGEEEEVAKAFYPSLFDIPQQVKRPKNTLFD